MASWNGFRVASLVGLACAALAGAQDEATSVRRPADADELFRGLAALEGLEADFVEEKHLALLLKPLESRGKLYFLPPSHLTRVTLEPRPARLAIGPRELRMSGSEGEEVLDLGTNEAVRALVTSLVRVFAGQQDELAGAYELAYMPSQEDEQAWRLELTPRAEPLNQMVRRITVEGELRAVTRFSVEEPNGDRSVTRILRSDPERRFSDAERSELFGLEIEPGR